MRHTKYNIRNARNEPRVIHPPKQSFCGGRTGRESRAKAGSAFILAVVLTTLLAIIGVMFVMVSRVDKIATSAIAENRELNFAVETVIAKISQELVLDVPGIADPNEKYYDYPDANDAWLASLEPYKHAADDYRWQQISDIYRRFGTGALPAGIIPDYQDPAYVKDSNTSNFYPADADGDGVADSMWVKLDGVTSGKGKPIYAAIRIIDNGGMLNVNTGYKFDPCELPLIRKRVDGSSQMQINLMALAGRPDYNDIEAAQLLEERTNYPGSGINPDDLGGYERDIVWQYGETSGLYTPFDISDELELRNRFLLNHEDIDTRLELWGGEFRNKWMSSTPFKDTDEWFVSAYDDGGLDPNYAYRHLATTYNMDRIINPSGGKMLNVNRADANSIYGAVRTADLNLSDAVAARIAVNLKDFRDEDEIVSTVDDIDGVTHYGFERPCIYISELAHVFRSANDPNDPNRVHRSYAIELHKPYSEDGDPINWRLTIDNDFNNVPDVDVVWSGTQRFHVIQWIDPCAPMKEPNFADTIDYNHPYPVDGVIRVDPSTELGWPMVAGADSYDVYFGINEDDVRDANNTPGLWPEFKGNQTETYYDPGGMVTSTTYYWRIDDANNSGVVLVTGDVWGFTTYDSPAEPDVYAWDPNKGIVFDSNSVVYLRRYVPDVNELIVVDSIIVPDGNAASGWLAEDANPHSIQRDITRHRCIKRLWDPYGRLPTLGYMNDYRSGNPHLIQAHPANEDFTNVGEIGMVFRKSAYLVGAYRIGPNDTEFTARINLADPNFQQIFKYLTVFDPSTDGIDNDGDGVPDNGKGEWKIPGRININTAPWYVIAQLPWVSDGLAQAIVAYRDKLGIPVDYSGSSGRYDTTGINGIREELGFESIGELTTVINKDSGKDYYSMHYYALDPNDLDGFPDLTPSDGAADDFEERDVIFARISNLVTVRSDVFTAYILVRIGADGPQKRMVAILDRSEVDPTGGKVKVRALQPVPDPR